MKYVYLDNNFIKHKKVLLKGKENMKIWDAQENCFNIKFEYFSLLI